MIIRDAQIQAFVDAQNRTFESELFVFLVTQFPERCSLLGDESVRKCVHAGRVDKLCQRFTSKRSVARFIMLMFAIGVDFNQTHVPKWTRRILERHSADLRTLNQIARRVRRATPPRSALALL